MPQTEREKEQAAITPRSQCSNDWAFWFELFELALTGPKAARQKVRRIPVHVWLSRAALRRAGRAWAQLAAACFRCLTRAEAELRSFGAAAA